jgi:hypothetical protein
LGALPAANDPESPTRDELAKIEATLREYQRIFDTH